MENTTTPVAGDEDYEYYYEYYALPEGYDVDAIFESHRIMSVVIFSVVCVLGVLGNGTVIWGATSGFGKARKNSRSAIAWYLNLAVADFLITAFLPLEITYAALDFHWPFGRFACKLGGAVFSVNMYASVYTLALISVDRCVRVVRPGSRGLRTAGTSSAVVWVSLGVWATALALSIPGFVFGDTRTSVDDSKVHCYSNYALVTDWLERTPEEKRLHEFRRAVMVVTRFVAGFAVPFSVVVACYSVVACRLRSDRRLLLATAGQSGGGGGGRCSFETVAAVVIAAFFLCWVPYHVVLLVGVCYENGLIERSHVLDLAIGFGEPATLALALFNSCVNPLLYAAFGLKAFKDALRGSRSILKVLEKVFAEEPRQSGHDTATNSDVARSMITLSEIDGSAGMPGTPDPSPLTENCPEPKSPSLYSVIH